MQIPKNIPFPFDRLLCDLVSSACTALSEGLVGIYLHGSLAMGCFNPDKSDIDLLLVTEEAPIAEQKKQFMDDVIRLNASAPPKGLELSVVTAHDLDPFVYPTPYTLHFSPTHLERYLRDPWDYVRSFHGTDPDLAAHCTVTLQYGQVLYGRPISAVFGTVPREAYLDSIRLDVENAPEDILRDPVYITLNLCRVAAFAKEGICLSKKNGGAWGLSHLPQAYHPLIAEMLACYHTARQPIVPVDTARCFAEDMLVFIQKLS